GRVDRRDGPAPLRARPAARLQGAAVPAHADPLDRRLPLDHQGPARGHDLRVRDLGERGDRLVLLLRHPPLDARQAVMTIVAGFDPDAHGRAVLHLAAMLARSADDDLVVCAVIPEPWPPGPARVDAEYRAQV